MHPKQKGDVTTARVMAALIAAGFRVLVPWGENHRYDLVIEDTQGTFYRIQCKTARLVTGCLAFNSSSTGNPNDPSRHNYLGQADFFGLFAPDLDKCYLVPVEKVATVEVRLRLEPTRNNQSKGVTWAATYEISPQISARSSGDRAGTF
jgi:hypothetical protein